MAYHRLDYNSMSYISYIIEIAFTSYFLLNFFQQILRRLSIQYRRDSSSPPRNLRTKVPRYFTKVPYLTEADPRSVWVHSVIISSSASAQVWIQAWIQAFLTKYTVPRTFQTLFIWCCHRHHVWEQFRGPLHLTCTYKLLRGPVPLKNSEEHADSVSVAIYPVPAEKKA